MIAASPSRAQIDRTLDGLRLRHRFGPVVGYEEVPIERQKPSPEGLLLCLRTLAGSDGAGSDGRVAFFIGDHETDMITAANANRELEGRGQALRVKTIAARFLPGAAAESWSVAADFEARHPRDVVEIGRAFLAG